MNVYAWKIRWAYTDGKLYSTSPETHVVAPTLAAATVLAYKHPPENESYRIMFSIECCGHPIPLTALWRPPPLPLSPEQQAARELEELLAP